MAFTPRSTGFWQSVRAVPARTPLRTKLITAVLALVAIALVVISVAGISLLRSNLLTRSDNELTVLYEHAINNHSVRGGLGPPGYFTVGERQIIEAIPGSGSAYPAYPYSLSSTDPLIPTSASWLASNALRPVTVPAQTGGDRWRVIVDPKQAFTVQPSGLQITGTLVVGIDVTDVYDTIGSVTIVLVVTGLAVLLLLGVVGIAVIRASLRPLADIEQTAQAIAAGDLARRVPERDPRTEVGLSLIHI